MIEPRELMLWTLIAMVLVGMIASIIPTKWCPPPWMLNLYVAIIGGILSGLLLPVFSWPEWAVYVMTLSFVYVLGGMPSWVEKALDSRGFFGKMNHERSRTD